MGIGQGARRSEKQCPMTAGATTRGTRATHCLPNSQCPRNQECATPGDELNVSIKSKSITFYKQQSNMCNTKLTHLPSSYLNI
ncbi:MAG: hypothetical protein KME31_24210 [Tolypothrix carrinoi HA7290-LM1]|nr:hypothetical protein [Tolypothrix carrinoi HA7290-LM1]